MRGSATLFVFVQKRRFGGIQHESASRSGSAAVGIGRTLLTLGKRGQSSSSDDEPVVRSRANRAHRNNPRRPNDLNPAILEAGSMGARSSKGLKARSRSSGNLYTVKKGDLVDRFKLGGSVPNNLWAVGKTKHAYQYSHEDLVVNRNRRNQLYQNGCEIHRHQPQHPYHQSLPRSSADLVHTDTCPFMRRYDDDGYYISERAVDHEWEVSRTAPGTPGFHPASRGCEDKAVMTVMMMMQQLDAEDMVDSGTKVDFSGGRINYPFIAKENTFEVLVSKGSQGLGLSVCGGCETKEPWPGLIRIKKLFPHQPAWQTSRLQSGDILLKANGVPLSGLSNYEALEVLRMTPPETVLTVCRPSAGIFSAAMALVQSQPNLSTSNSSSQTDLAPSHHNYLTPPKAVSGPCGEFEVCLTKVNGSLGFTLRKEDESIMGHYVRALVKEPALSDGRIKPGDRIISVNNVDLSPMTHADAVTFLRKCPDDVTLRLYRDESQTPISPMSPSESEKKFKPKPLLRKEAMDMLCDLAVRKITSPSGSPGTPSRRRLSLETGQVSGSRRNHRRLTRTPPSPDRRPTDENSWPSSPCSSISYMSPPPDFRNRTFVMDGNPDFRNRTFAVDGNPDFRNRTFAVDGNPDATFDVQPKRPDFLDLSGSRRRKRFVLSDRCPDNVDVPDSSQPDSVVSEPSTNRPKFSYHNPAYQSATVGSCMAGETSPTAMSDRDVTSGAAGDGEGSQGLLKWKGVVFTPEEEQANKGLLGIRESPDGKEDTSAGERDDDDVHEEKILTVELSRGWSSRLGFSLQGAGGITYISAIYTDSVAARDGRLRVGDQLLQVNGEDVEGMDTAEVIDIFRKTRGTVVMTVLRKPPAMPS